KQLLTLTTSSNDFLGLELALLEVMSSETASTKELTKPVQNTPAPRTKDEAVKNKSEPVIEKTPSKNNVNDETNEDKKEEQQKEAKTPKIQVEFNNDTWTELLNDLKKKHNTLYGVLRMATPEQDQKTIILSFGFDFHKKQVDNPKNVSIIRDYLRDYFGVHDYSTKVSKNLSKTPEPSTPTPQKSESVDAVANVSNIFGSAELLD
ncbi:hypothetical protein KC959_02680, partial [Candidatus Saccharibacteria bacterium]|nr:hypothetical protein [Candidatus Saccharibacteria bacterium]